MTDVYHHQGGQVMPQQQQHHQQQQYWSESRVHQVAKAATAVAAGLSLLVLAGLTFVGTVIALMVATPLMVIFSPVLVPAAIALFLLAAGFLASGVFGIAAAMVFTWMYKYASTGEHPRFAESMDQATQKLGSKAREFWDNTAGGGGGAVAGGGRSYRTNETRSYK